MRRDEALAILWAHADELKAMGAASVALFGSVARDEAGPGSDVDVLVEFAEPETFASYMDLKFRLEELFGRRVDLLTVEGLRPRVRPYVERDLIRVA